MRQMKDPCRGSTRLRLLHSLCFASLTFSACTEPEKGVSEKKVIGFEALFMGLLQPKCAQEACHGGARGVAGVRFVELEESYAQLVDATPTNARSAEAGLKRVSPGDVERSLLWAKLSAEEGELSAQGWGAPMPMATDQRAGDNTLTLLREWIEAGAPREEASLAERGLSFDERLREQGDAYVTCAEGVEASAEGLRTCFAPPEDERALRLYTPPLAIPPHSEVLICSYLDMPISEPLFVNRTLGQQMTGGHHAAVFLAVSPSDEPPHECRDDEMSNFRFAAGAGGGGGQDTQLPPSVALKIEPGQQFVIQSHYLNPSDEPMLVMDAVDLITIPEAEVESRVDPFALIQGSFEVPVGGAPYEVRKRCRL